MSASSVLALDLAAFATAVEGVADTAFLLVDGDQRIATWNDGARLLTGVPASAAIGEAFPDVLAPYTASLPPAPALAARGESGIEVELARLFGGPEQIAATTRVRATARPVGPGWLVILRQAPAPVRGGQPPDERLVLRAMRELVMVADLDGIVTYWNAAATDVLGFSAEERVGKPMFGFVPEERRGPMAEMLRTLKSGLEWESEYPAVHKDGSTVWTQARATTLRNEAGEPTALVVMAHDIRQRKEAEQALAAREAAYRAAVETTGDGYCVVSANDGRILEVNHVYARISGYSRDELLQMRISDVEALEDAAAVEARLARIAAHGHDRFETWYRRKDGGTWPVEITVTLVRDSGLVHVFARDITERQRAEEALRTSEARLLNAQRAARLGSWEWDPRTGQVWWSDAIRTMFGVGPDDPASFDEFLRVLHPDDRARAIARVEAVLQGAEGFADDLRIVNPDGSISWIDSRGRAVRDETGTLLRVDGTDHDITDRKRAHEERDRLWNHSPDLLCVFDLEGDFTQVNPAWTERLGWSEAALLAQPVGDLMHPDDRAGAAAALDRLRAGHAVRNFETRLRTTDGQWRWFSWNAQPVPGGHVHAFVRDISDEKRLDEERRQSQKIEAIGRLAGGVAHDFNNLLTVINGYTAFLLEGPTLHPSQREPLMAVRDAGDRAASLTAQLLAFGRKAMVEPKVLDLNEVTRASTRMLARLIGEDVQLVTDLAPNLPQVRIDPSQLDQVLVNLVVNARDAMPRGGLLRIQTALTHVDASMTFAPAELPPGRYVRLTVSDTGAGISEDVRAHIFEPFYTTKDVGQGTGLGLATVYGIVRQAGGTVRVESERGHGSAFHVLLPAISDSPAEAAESSASAPTGGHETVLIVEDEPGVRQLTRLLLEAQGYAVYTAAAAREALEVVASAPQRIDLLITDVVMPGMSGQQLALALRERHPDLRVLFMSGYTDDAVLRHGVESSVDAFLQKPFTPVVLAQHVREVLDAPR